MAAARDEALAAEHTAGMLYAEAAETALLSAEEERTLALRAQAGDTAARDQMARANIRLVGAVARVYASRHGASLLEEEDLLQEGAIGLLRAIEKFDTTRGVRFSTHATWWIWQAISRAIDNQSTLINVPVGVRVLQRKLLRLRDAQHAAGLPADTATLAALAGITPEETRKAFARLQPLPRYLSEQVGDDEDASLLEDIIGDPAADERLELAERRAEETTPTSLVAIMRRFAQGYRPHGAAPERDFVREMRVLWRHQVGGEALAPIAAEMGVSREWARQMELAAIEAVLTERARLSRMARSRRWRAAGARKPSQQTQRARDTANENGGAA